MKTQLFFDKQDYELLSFINKVLIMEGDAHTSEDMLNVNLHPHGIKTLALSREMLVANAMIRLLGSTEGRDSSYRLQALQTLYDEVLNSAKTSFRRNTARVLVEIMKALVRAHGDIQKQLYLASDFRHAAQGKPVAVRRFLQEYGLVEMPEDWSQLAFDHHVHDANTKGRKSATHLLMDAWLKGIRYITVIYYNYINEETAYELMHAAAIIGIHLRIGIEYSLPFGDKHIQFVWAPRHATNPERFLEFLAEAPMQHLMSLGRQASAWRQRLVFALLEVWNSTHMPNLAADVGLMPQDFPMLCKEDFLKFVGAGQASRSHLVGFIHEKTLPVLQRRAEALVEEANSLPLDKQEESLAILQKQHDLIKGFTQGYVFDTYVARHANMELESEVMRADNAHLPQLMRLTPLSLLDWLTSFQDSGFIILNLAGLTAEDVLTLLWQCQGLISHLELYNLREWDGHNFAHIQEISLLQQALNSGSIPRIKALILRMLKEREALDASMETTDNVEALAFHKRRKEVLKEILSNIITLRNFYCSSKLRSRMGSNTTDRINVHSQMGIVFPETLPRRAQKALEKEGKKTEIPFHIAIRSLLSYTPLTYTRQKSAWLRIIRALPFCGHYGHAQEKEWRTNSASAVHGAQSNMRLLQVPRRKESLLKKEQKMPPVRYLTTRLQNCLKVILGLIPAAIAFHYTQTWWVLAWFGPIIWFGITGVRNIIQAVVAGTGFYRYSLLRWKDYVSWSRLCDSLMYTGFSVPILELGVRIFLLQDTLHMTSVSDPLVVYTVMSVVNGVYIAWHNLLRGFPKEAVIGNLFRSVLAIPVALLFNALFEDFLLYVLQIQNPDALLQNTAAIVSKLASDTVAAIIEGYADQKNLLRLRTWDYTTKLQGTFNTYARIDLAFPQEDINDMLSHPKTLLAKLGEKDPALKEEVIINALDFMYFWYYRPRSQQVFQRMLRRMTSDERKVFGLFQLVLGREREVSQIFVDGLVGRNFGPSLAFYLEKHAEYVKRILPLCVVGTGHEKK